jgi:hypothetical protein
VRDRIVGVLEDVRRFRCVSADCGWEGIISTDWMPHSVRTQSAMTWFARLTWMVVGVAVALVGMSALKMYRNVRPTKAPVAVVAEAEPLLVPSGVSHDGVDLPPSDPRVIGNPSSLSLRRGCAWGVPGRSPYKGTVSQALSGARLPPEVVRKVEAMVARGVVSEQLEISRDAIRTVSGKRQFDTNIVAMGFGSTLCFGTRVNFEPGHVERADLYDATDADGARFAVMVPYVCGNVSVLAERAERPEGGGGGGGTSIPEPTTLLLVASGLAAMAVRAWISRATRRGMEVGS